MKNGNGDWGQKQTNCLFQKVLNLTTLTRPQTQSKTLSAYAEPDASRLRFLYLRL